MDAAQIDALAAFILANAAQVKACNKLNEDEDALLNKSVASVNLGPKKNKKKKKENELCLQTKRNN
jgi:hypothetical protein